jgi:hypothetical protein
MLGGSFRLSVLGDRRTSLSGKTGVGRSKGSAAMGACRRHGSFGSRRLSAATSPGGAAFLLFAPRRGASWAATPCGVGWMGTRATGGIVASLLNRRLPALPFLRNEEHADTIRRLMREGSSFPGGKPPLPGARASVPLSAFFPAWRACGTSIQTEHVDPRRTPCFRVAFCSSHRPVGYCSVNPARRVILLLGKENEDHHYSNHCDNSEYPMRHSRGQHRLG